MCQGITAKGLQCTSKHQKEDVFCKKHRKQADKPPPVDDYTESVLRECLSVHKDYVLKRKEIKARTGLDIRLANMPEDISENISKFIIRFHVGDVTSQWTKAIKGKAGDLTSCVEKTQEVKCFTSDGPPSFGPNEKWDVIYFLDARKWLEDRFVLWRVPLSNASAEWKAIKMSKTQTAEDQNEQGRRPRITWDSLYPQIKDYTTKIFEGSFEDIFRPAKAPVGQQSASPPEPTLRSLPACTDESQPGPEACSPEEIPGN